MASGTAGEGRRRRLGRPAAFVAVAACTDLAACQASVLDPRGPIGAAEKIILIDSLAVMLVIVVPVILAILGFAWWFRASNTRARHLPTWAYSGQIELVTWSIPVLVVLFLGGITWVGAHDLDPAQPLTSRVKPINVQVVSLDWKWLFIYPDDGVASVNRLVIPVGAPVNFTLTSASVMNTFFVPQLGGMIYTMNGMTDQLHLRADTAGVYQGRSGHFSGDGFSGMHFDVDAVTPQAFQAWVAGARTVGAALDDDGYRHLARQSQDVAPFTYRAVAAGLFQDVVTQTLPPAPGPQASRTAPVTPPTQDR